MPYPQSLIEAIQGHELVPFVGAGLSMTIKADHFPSWLSLIERLAKRCEEEQIATAAHEVREKLVSGDAILAAEVALQALKKPRFLDEIERIFDKQPTYPDLSSVCALWRLKPELVITTNYDNVLFLPFKTGYTPLRIHNSGHARHLTTLLHRQTQETKDPQARSYSRRAFVWHIHGSLERPNLIILAQSQYQEFYEKAAEEKNIPIDRPTRPCASCCPGAPFFSYVSA